jgi:hypothetical protein
MKAHHTKEELTTLDGTSKNTFSLIDWIGKIVEDNNTNAWDFFKRHGYSNKFIQDCPQEDRDVRVSAIRSAEEHFTRQSYKTRTLAEQLLQRAGVRQGLEDYAEEITEKAPNIVDLEGGYGSINIVDLRNGDIVKINIPRRHDREVLVYKLLQGTATSRNIPEFKDECHNDEVGLIRLGKYPKYPASLEKMLRNPSKKNREAYINESLRVMAQLHADLTGRAEEGDFDTDQERHNSKSNPNLRLIKNPRKNKGYRHFKRELSAYGNLADALEIAVECEAIIAEESDCIIQGDWKPDNGLIYDFAGARKGLELEDIMRLMTSYVVKGTRQEARDAVNTYIKYRSEVDSEFEGKTRLHKILRKYADLFYRFESSIYASSSSKRDLEVSKYRNQRLFHLANMAGEN